MQVTEPLAHPRGPAQNDGVIFVCRVQPGTESESHLDKKEGNIARVAATGVVKAKGKDRRQHIPQFALGAVRW